MQPKISILIPAYQVEQFLHRCLNSVFAQTYQNLEIVIFDDGSTDGTLAIIEEYAKIHKNIKYKSLSHCGLSIIRNQLIEESTGEYFFFLDADDFITSDAIQSLYDISIQYKAEIVQGEMERTSQDVFLDMSDNGVVVYTREQALNAYNRSFKGPRCNSAGKLYKKGIFDGISYPTENRLYEDEYVAFLLLDKCSTFVALGRKLYAHYQNENSIMHLDFSLRRYDCLIPIMNSIEFFKKLNIPKQVSRLQFRYLVLLRELYTKTANMLPDETQRLQTVMEEYCKMLPLVLSTLELPDDVVANFKSWEMEPLTTESFKYWWYVKNKFLPE